MRSSRRPSNSAVQAVNGALAAAGLAADEVDVIFSTTVTGLAVPSLEARIAARVGFREDIKRVPLFGLGCVAGAAGIARLHDYLRGWPDHVGDSAVRRVVLADDPARGHLDGPSGGQRAVR